VAPVLGEELVGYGLGESAGGLGGDFYAAEETFDELG
jgi:hypothetical protein